MNEGMHLDLDTWIVPGQIHKANLCRGLGNSYKPTEVLISAVAHNTPPPFQAAQNASSTYYILNWGFKFKRIKPIVWGFAAVPPQNNYFEQLQTVQLLI